MWNRLVRVASIVTGLAVLGGCAGAQVNTEYGAGSDLVLNCTPIDPLATSMPTDPCFRAVRYTTNEITLQWRVINAKKSVYIYGDSGRSGMDLGEQPAYCRSQTANVCSTTVSVTAGGYYRWQLKVEGSRRRYVHVAADITIAPPYPPVVKQGGGLVDILRPTRQKIVWEADSRNALLDLPLDRAWIEFKPPKTFWHEASRLPRSGREAFFTVPAADLVDPGRSIYYIRDCFIPEGGRDKFCSEQIPVGFSTDNDHFLVTNPVYTANNKRLNIPFTTASGDVRRLYSKTLLPRQYRQSYLETGKASYTVAAQLLTPGVHTLELESCRRQRGDCAPREKLRVIVSAGVAPVTWILGRDYREDFASGLAYEVLGNGEPLDVTYDEQGGIWAISEHSSSIEHLTPQGVLQTLTVPLRRNKLSSSSSVLAKPFASEVYGSQIKAVTFSTLAERATRVGSTVWFTQGGASLVTAKKLNRSRVVSYNPDGLDYPNTPYDDRLCVYTIPADDENHFGNNQIVGLTAARNRIWIAESRGFYNVVPSVISSFIPDPENCENELNFDSPEALAAQRLQYCAPGRTPERDGCVEKFLLDKIPPGLTVAHLATDPVDDSVWFTDLQGLYLGNLNPSRANPVEVYALPDPHNEIGWYRGFPWSIKADRDAVYFGEYATKHLLRFDKATATFDEIFVPTNSEMRLHSIDIDAATNRLWFTLTNVSLAPRDVRASTIGYIDLSSWSDRLANPNANKTVHGVVYKGLDSIPHNRDGPGLHQCFRGIAVDPASGKIALATMRRRQITELTPHSGFWP